MAQGRAIELDERGSLTPCVLEARFSLRGPAGAIEGQVALHQPGEASPTRIEGPYEGQVQPLGGMPAAITATFEESRTEGLTAEVTVDDSNFIDNPHFRGAVALLDTVDTETKELQTSFALVGGGAAGLLVMRGIVGPQLPGGRRPARRLL